MEKEKRVWMVIFKKGGYGSPSLVMNEGESGTIPGSNCLNLGWKGELVVGGTKGSEEGAKQLVRHPGTILS